MIRSSLVPALLLASLAFCPLAQADKSSAWQASYDAETAGKFEQALDELKRLPAPQRDAYLANYRRGWLYYRLGRLAQSVASYVAAVNLEPASIEARVAVLLPMMALEQWRDVELTAQEVLKRDPENYLARQRLAFAKYSTKHFSEAEVLYRRLLVLYPSDVEMRAGLGWTVLGMGKAKDAAALFNQVLEVSSAHAGATRGLQAARAAGATGH
jgi:tetratricopeptide (TPR) repeat protein